MLAVCWGVNSGGEWETVVAVFISYIPAMEKKQWVPNIIGPCSPAVLADCSKVGTSYPHVLLPTWRNTFPHWMFSTLTMKNTFSINILPFETQIFKAKRNVSIKNVQLNGQQMFVIMALTTVFSDALVHAEGFAWFWCLVLSCWCYTAVFPPTVSWFTSVLWDNVRCAMKNRTSFVKRRNTFIHSLYYIFIWISNSHS